MSTDTAGKIFGNAILDVYGPDADFDPETDHNPYTVSGELTIAVLGEEGEHMRSGMADNQATQAEIRKRLKAQDPELLARLEFDSESGCFFAYADTEADAMALAGFITAMAHETESKPEPIARRMERNVIRFSAADVDSVLGRQATDDELRNIAKAAEHSIIPEAFHEVVELVCGIIESLDNDDESV